MRKNVCFLSFEKGERRKKRKINKRIKRLAPEPKKAGDEKK